MPGFESSPNQDVLYTSFGDTVPSFDQLKDVLRATTNMGNPVTAAYLRSNVYLDLARTEPDNDKWFTRARSCQRRVETLALKLSLTTDKESNALTLVDDYLLQADMPNWQRAIKSQPLQNEYEQMLTAAEKVLPFLLPSGHDQANTRLMEFVPLLLGARGLYNNYVHGWYGRSALHREESRTVAENPTKNFNWDSSISFECSAEDFLTPAVRLSVKKRFKSRGSRPRDRRQSSSAYAKAGILAVSATEYGFADPKKVVASCMHEMGMEQQIYRSNHLMRVESLDKMTDELFKVFKEHAATLAKE